MSRVAKRTFSLPAEHAAFIDAKVAAGAYASGSEVVRAGLRALQERDAAIEQWLREDVAAAYDAMKSNAERGIPAAEVFVKLRARRPDWPAVKRRRVVFSPEARDDLFKLYDWVAAADATGPAISHEAMQRSEAPEPIQFTCRVLPSQ